LERDVPSTITKLIIDFIYLHIPESGEESKIHNMMAYILYQINVSYVRYLHSDE
jgi:hypothetical protein